VGLAVNLMVAVWLRQYASSDLNVKSAFLHVVGDAAASVGVILAGLVIKITGWNSADPLISVIIGIIIGGGAVRIMIESSNILLEGVPKEVNLQAVMDDIRGVRGVSGVHSLHVWSICTNIFALSAHVDVAPSERQRTGQVLNEINERLAQRHHIFYTTIQAECLGCDTSEVFRRFLHKERRGHQH
jgi:cobalt-zinc-cadmium efflux system protein